MSLLEQCSSLPLAEDLKIPTPLVRKKEAGEPKVSQEACISQLDLLVGNLCLLTIVVSHTYINFSCMCSITAIVSRYLGANVPSLADSL